MYTLCSYYALWFCCNCFSKSIYCFYNFIKWKQTVSQEGGAMGSLMGSTRYRITRNTLGQSDPKVKIGYEGHFLRNLVCPGLGGPICKSQMRSSFGCNEEKVKTCFETLMRHFHSNCYNMARSPYVTFHLSDYGLFPIYLFLWNFSLTNFIWHCNSK